MFATKLVPTWFLPNNLVSNIRREYRKFQDGKISEYAWILKKMNSEFLPLPLGLWEKQNA